MMNEIVKAKFLGQKIPVTGDMLKSVYDPAGGNAQVAFSSDLGNYIPIVGGYAQGGEGNNSIDFTLRTLTSANGKQIAKYYDQADGFGLDSDGNNTIFGFFKTEGISENRTYTTQDKSGYLAMTNDNVSQFVNDANYTVVGSNVSQFTNDANYITPPATGGYLRTDGIGDAGRVAFFTTQYDATGDSNFFWNNTTKRLGIKTGSLPTYALDVRGTTQADGIRAGMGFDVYGVPVQTTTSLTLIPGAGNVTTGAHWYMVTYTTALGETQAGGWAQITTDTATNGQVTVGITASTDSRVTGRKIYRTVAGASQSAVYLLTTIANNTATTYTDNISDTTLIAGGGASGAGFYRGDSTTKWITKNGDRVFLADSANIFIGPSVGAVVTAAGRSVIVGNGGTGQSLTAGVANNIYGNSAGISISTGGANNLYGYGTGYSLTTGNDNVAMGHDAMLLGSTNAGSTAIGAYSMFGVAGNNPLRSTAVGSYSGYQGKDYSLSLGYYAGRYETANNKIILDTVDRSNEANGRLYAPFYSVTNATPSAQITSLGGTGKVGIGLIDPIYPFQVKTASGFSFYVADAPGAGVAIGSTRDLRFKDNNATYFDSNYTCFKALSNYYPNNYIKISDFNTGTLNGQFTLGATALTGTFYWGGKIGLGTTTPTNGNGTSSVLHIEGSDWPSLKFKSTSTTKSALAQTFNDSDYQLTFGIYGSAATSTLMGQNKANLAFIYSDRAVALGSIGNYGLSFATNALTRLNITNGGLVGIGKTATSLLDIGLTVDNTSVDTPIAFNVSKDGTGGFLTASSGDQYFAQISPSINQSGSAGWVGLRIYGQTSNNGTGQQTLLQVGDNTNHTKFDVSGSRYMVGDAHDMYGSMYIDGNKFLIPCTDIETYYELQKNFTYGGSASDAFTFVDEYRLQALKAGKYKVVWSITAGMTEDALIQGKVMINGTTQENTVGGATHSLSLSTSYITLSGTGIITLAVDDYVSLSIADFTNSGTTPEVRNATLTIQQVSG